MQHTARLDPDQVGTRVGQRYIHKRREWDSNRR
jgi:hypothetical protein